MNDSANSKRIVACVNACEGMADPAVEIAGLRSRSNGIEGMCAEVERLRGVNTELLAALERLANAVDAHCRAITTAALIELDDATINARAAIAKAKVGAK
jgi:hypothetical protein